MGDAQKPASRQAEVQQIEREYQRDVTITKARPLIANAAVLFWLLLDVGLVLFFLLTVVMYIVSGSFADQRLLGTLDNNVASLHESAAARAADPLLVGDPRVLTRDTGSYDVYAVIENPNTEWYATFTYTFSDGISAEPMKGAIMPSAQQYVLALNVELASRPSGATVSVDDVVWHRVDRHDVENTAEYLVDHSNFTVSDSAYDDSITIDSTKVGVSTFTITNNTPYSYYNPTFIVLLKQSGSVVGVNTVTVPQFASGTAREVDTRWFGSVPSTGSVEVLPSINYFDEDEYADPEGEAGTDLRDAADDRR